MQRGVLAEVPCAIRARVEVAERMQEVLHARLLQRRSSAQDNWRRLYAIMSSQPVRVRLWSAGRALQKASAMAVLVVMACLTELVTCEYAKANAVAKKRHASRRRIFMTRAIVNE